MRMAKIVFAAALAWLAVATGCGHAIATPPSMARAGSRRSEHWRFQRHSRTWSAAVDALSRPAWGGNLMVTCPSRHFCAAITDYGPTNIFDGTQWGTENVGWRGTKRGPCRCRAFRRHFAFALTESGATYRWSGTRWASVTGGRTTPCDDPLGASPPHAALP